jgi:MPBQ/MSBQ methyltransferase
VVILLTGATGFIGSRVLARLIAQGEQVRVLIRPATLARRDVASELGRYPTLDVVAADLSDEDTVARATNGMDVVLHLAWQWKRSQDPTMEAPPAGEPADVRAIEHNLSAARHLLAASIAQGVRRFVFTSSVAVYGPPATIRKFPITEDSEVIQGDYGDSAFARFYMSPKIAIEHMIRSYGRQCGLEYVILRPSVVYGPQAPFAERLVRKTLAAPRWVAPGGSPGKWQMVHVDDVAQAVVLAGTTAEARNLEFNIAGSEISSEQEIKMMIWTAASAEEPSADASSEPRRRFESYEFPRYDISRAGRLLHYTPQVPLREGLEEMVSTVLSRRHESDRNDPGAIAQASHASGSAPGHPDDRAGDEFDVRQFYDERVESEFLTAYFEESGFWNFGYRVTGAESPRQACEQLVDRLVSMLGEARGAILDVACGNGATTAHLRRHFPANRITGINFSARQLARAVQRAPESRFVLMDATALALAANTFDHMICVEAAFHFDTRDAFFREAVRVLKPGGRLVLSDAVLPPGSQTQPRANYVTGADDYRARCLASGFSDVAVIDATSQCWAAFRADLAHYTRRKLRAGELSLRRFFEVMLWLRQLGPERYLLASCVK